MMAYLLVAVGGAIGSVLRYAVGLASIAAWGNDFPWGTILINVTGSFVIGLVGASAVAGGILPASPGLRLLLMVGFCGGFTTFSSFSLQTLELLRDGRIGGALLNASLSFVLCLLAVAAGGAAANGLARGARIVAAQREPVAVHRVLVILDRTETAIAQLSAASRLGPAMRIDALAIRTVPREVSMPTEEVAGPRDPVRMRLAERRRTDELRQLAERWARSNPGGVASFSAPLDEPGHAVRAALAQSGAASAVVVGRPGGDRDAVQRSGSALYAALFDAARPVLMVPPLVPGGDLRLDGTIVVAWKDDGPARAAVAAAAPLLRRAGRVVLVNDPGLHQAPAILRDLGIEAELASLHDGEGSTAGRLLETARDLRADLLVMGAFAHAPLRERLLGGVTRTMIETATLPVFMAHGTG